MNLFFMHLSGGGAGFTAGMSSSGKAQNPEGVSIVQAKKKCGKKTLRFEETTN